MSADTKLLGIYLNDHLAGSTLGRELAKRTLGANRGTELGTLLEWLVPEVVEDRETLRSIMLRLEVREDPVKRAVAFAGERAGRLKLNGQLRGYSPLSRLVELEGLALGIEGKASLWRSLRALDDPRLAEFALDGLDARARAQREALEPHRIEAARTAFAA